MKADKVAACTELNRNAVLIHPVGKQYENGLQYHEHEKEYEEGPIIWFAEESGWEI